MWGSNSLGQLGDGTTTYKTVPTKIMDNVVDVSLGESHSAAITKDGSLYMWGFNSSGQVGNGESTKCDRPRKITIFLSGEFYTENFICELVKGNICVAESSFDGIDCFCYGTYDGEDKKICYQ